MNLIASLGFDLDAPGIADNIENQTCPECGEPCTVIKEDDSFDYAYGDEIGVEYPAGYGKPVSDCCGVRINIEE